MKTFTFLKGILSLCLLFVTVSLFSQTITFSSPASGSTTSIPVNSSLTLTSGRTTSNWSGGNNNFTFTWTKVSGPNGVTFTPASVAGNSISSASTSASFTIAGTYVISCTVNENGGGESHTTSSGNNITIVAGTPALSLSPSASQTTIAGGTLSFSATTSFYPSGTTTYTWSATGATIPSGNNSSKTIAFPSAGAYSVSVEAVNGSTNLTSATTTVNVFSLSAGSDQLVPGTSTNLIGTASGPGSITYAWTRVSGPNTPGISGSTNQNASLSDLVEGTYVYRLTINGNSTLADDITIRVISGGNLWATSSNGAQISSFAVNNGVYLSGPTNIFAPDGGSTAALGRSAFPSSASGYFYWLPNSGSNGVVTIYGASAAGNDETEIASFDVNGSGDNNDMGFVRLAMGANGTGWILAKENNTNNLFLAKFTPDGIKPVTVTVDDNNVSLVGGSTSTFVNGDICLSGSGAIYALANNGSGVTQIFLGVPNGNSTTFTKKWDLRDASNNPFTGSVNGVAFDAAGSIYISTADGLYFIDQTTVNAGAGTVLCTLVRAQTGLQDLASNVFPSQTALPVRLLSFSGSLRNDMTTLTWETDNEVSFDRFEIERSNNGSVYTMIGNKPAMGSTSRTVYQYTDNLSSVSGEVFYYRLKMMDADGKFKYSNVILVRKDQKNIKGLSLNPNPVINGIATARFTASANSNITFRVLDLSGKLLAQQQNRAYEGSNSVGINNLDRLQPGTYVLQMANGAEISEIKFLVAR